MIEGPSSIRQVIFRVDSSFYIGTGHTMRCLTLAKVLRENEIECNFICRSHAGNQVQLIKDQGFGVCELLTTDSDRVLCDSQNQYAQWLGVDWETDAEETLRCVINLSDDVACLVVDHYALDSRWERRLRPYANKIMVIDDLANRSHDCDLLLDQNLPSARKDYSELIPSSSVLLNGPEYALLRPEFAKNRVKSLKKRPSVSRVDSLLVCMGGVDKDNIAGSALDIISGCNPPKDLRVVVVVGSNFPWLSELKLTAESMPCDTRILVGIDNMASVMTTSDLSIGSAGSSSWERCCLGLPTVQFVLAENQRSVAIALEEAGAAVCSDLVSLKSTLHRIFSHSPYRKQILKTWLPASGLTDGRGAGRVASELIGLLH